MGKFLLAALRKLGSSTFATVERVGGKVVGTVEKVADKFLPGAALPPAVAGTVRVATGATVVSAGVGAGVGGVAQGTGGAIGDSLLATATEYVPALVPEKYQVHDNKSFMQRVGENFIPGMVNGAINGATWIPVSIWKLGRGGWDYVTGNTTKDNMGTPPKPAGQTGDTSKETTPMVDTGTPLAVTAPPPADPAAIEAAKKAAAEKAAQEQAAKATELEAAKKKAEAEKQAEAEKLSRQKAANDAEFEKAKRERAEELAREGEGSSFAEKFNEILGGAGAGAKDLFDKINIWDGIRKVTEWVNQPGVPKLFRQGWNWLVGVLNTDAVRSIGLGLAALTGLGTGWDVLKRGLRGDVKGATASLAEGGVKTGLLAGLALQRPTGTPAANEDDYGSPPAGNDDIYDGQGNRGRGRGHDRQPPRSYNDSGRPRTYQVSADGNALNQDATSTAAFRNASGPAANGAAPVYAYGAAPGNNGQSLADDFNNKGGSLMVTNVVPPVQPVQRPGTGANYPEYHIDRSA